MIILNRLEECRSASGYDVIKHMQKRFNMLLSSGTVYSVLHSLEKRRLIEKMPGCGKTIYRLTDGGWRFLRETNDKKTHLQVVFSAIFP